jgi:5-carboxymethyl-2-hydroxymuconate isomerase
MPHLVMLYTRDLEAATDIDALCRTLCDAMLSVKDESGKQVFPTGGTRVLAYPTAYSAVADGRRDYSFLYMNLRMAKGRSGAVHQTVGDALVAAAKTQLAPLFEQRHIGMTVQVDEGHEVFDAKVSTIHPLFQTP